jgi:hypothetical protein
VRSKKDSQISSREAWRGVHTDHVAHLEEHLLIKMLEYVEWQNCGIMTTMSWDEEDWYQ